MYAVNQEDFLMATVGDAEYIEECKALLVCGTPFASTKGMDGCSPPTRKARELLKEAGYDGTPIVLMQPTDLQSRQPGAGGQAADGEGRLQGRHAVDGLADVVARRAKHDAPDKGGWNAFITSPSPTTRSHPWRAPSTAAATRLGSAGRAMRRWKSCATTMRARPIPPSRRHWPTPYRCAASR